MLSTNNFLEQKSFKCSESNGPVTRYIKGFCPVILVLTTCFSRETEKYSSEAMGRHVFLFFYFWCVFIFIFYFFFYFFFLKKNKCSINLLHIMQSCGNTMLDLSNFSHFPEDK